MIDFSIDKNYDYYQGMHRFTNRKITRFFQDSRMEKSARHVDSRC